LDRIYRPVAAALKPHHRRKPPDDEGRGQGRDVPPRDRGGAPAACGWEDKTLVIQAGESDEDQPPFEQRYSLSEDGQRLIEVVGFKGGRSGGFTLSRVWDRIVPVPAPESAEKSRALPGS